MYNGKHEFVRFRLWYFKHTWWDKYILNIIGDYVKADNIERDFQEKYMKGVIGKNSIELFEIIEEFNSTYTKKGMTVLIVNYFMLMILVILKLLINI